MKGPHECCANVVYIYIYFKRENIEGKEKLSEVSGLASRRLAKVKRHSGLAVLTKKVSRLVFGGLRKKHCSGCYFAENGGRGDLRAYCGGEKNKR